jgi:hypothetical protein
MGSGSEFPQKARFRSQIHRIPVWIRTTDFTPRKRCQHPVNTSVADPGCLSGSRQFSENYRTFYPKHCHLPYGTSQNYGFGIRDPGSGKTYSGSYLLLDAMCPVLHVEWLRTLPGICVVDYQRAGSSLCVHSAFHL